MKSRQNIFRKIIITRLLMMVLILVALGIVIALLSLLGRPSSASIPDVLEPKMTYEVLNAYPHDPEAFTQGLIYNEGYLYESTGLYGESSLRKVALESGEVLQQVTLPPDYFAEGLTWWENSLIQLTWREQTGFIYDLESFSLLGQFNYPLQGWGLTHDGDHLIMSDGTPTLYFLDADTFEVIGQIEVQDEGTPLWNINELEYIRGEIFANIWQTDDIIRIDPKTGAVKGWIDMRGILSEDLTTPTTNVLNGIAFDAAQNRLFVTGKRWPMLYQIRLIPLSGDPE